MSDQTDLPLFNFLKSLSTEKSDPNSPKHSDPNSQERSDTSPNDKTESSEPEGTAASETGASASPKPKKARKRALPKLIEMPNATPVISKAPVVESAEKAKTIEFAKPAEIVTVENTPEVLEPPLPAKVAEPQILSIEELNVTIKKMLEGQFHLIWVRGEISNFKAHSSGHFYFSLKDAKSQISAVMFRGYSSKLRFRPADGVEVIVRGRISVFEPRGSYQILCEMMEPVGAGALQRAFEELKEKLKAEGLFESARKKPIPSHPRHVAIVTSPTGAAIRDIINVLTRRAPWLPITIVPTIVQGEGCAPKICEAFEKAQRIPGVDVIIVGRGGGSIEDLWGFNDERLARLIAASKIPVISAVGHEIDFTIADFVADLRAPTPSAAAELVAKSSNELTSRLQQLERLLRLNTSKKLQNLDQKLTLLCKSLVDPQKKLQDLALRNDDLLTRMQMAKDRALSERRYKLKILQERMGTPMSVIQERLKGLRYHQQGLNKSLSHFLEMKHSKLNRYTSMLDTLSPLKVVERGYSVVKKEQQVITNIRQIAVGEMIQIKLAHGQIEARVEALKEDDPSIGSPLNKKD